MSAADEINEEILAGPEYGAGMVKDPETGCTLILWIRIHRDTFQRCEYVIPREAPQELAECLEAMKDVIRDQAIISIRLLKVEDILAALNPKEETEEYRRAGAMALCALNQAFEDHLRKRYRD